MPALPACPDMVPPDCPTAWRARREIDMEEFNKRKGGSSSVPEPPCDVTWRLQPVRGNAVIVVDRTALVVVPGFVVQILIARRAGDLVPGQVDPVAIELFVIVELFPRQRIVIIANTKEAAEAEDGVGDTAAALFEKEARKSGVSGKR